MSPRVFFLLSLLLFSLIIFVIVLDAQTYYQPQVVIVPHHDIVKRERREVLAEVARLRPQTKTIILLSPDHFNPNQHLITSSNQNWTTPQGPLNYDPIVGAPLKQLVVNNPTAVKNDHGIYALLSDIKTYFPESQIVPILLGQQLKNQYLEPLASALNQFCLADCLIIASVDFSHYLPASLANIHDAFSLKTLSHLDLDSVMALEVDSPQSLYLALSHAPPRFILKKHTNSGELISNYDVETTSHVMGWFQRGQPHLINTQTFLYAIDLQLASNKKTVGERFFYGADLTNTHLRESQTLAPNLIIQPTSSSAIVYSGHHLIVNLAEDFAVASTLSPAGDWQLVILPLSGVGPDRVLARGPLKQAALNRLFAGLPPPFQTNVAQGTITYRSNSAMLK